jgi:carbonic anhydrase/acetyltransferase-like protein (isoleucine patch superfamily)
MGAIIMDGVVIEENCIIAAGAVVSPGTHIPSGTVYAGVPANFLKNVDKNLIQGEINRIANNYVLYSSWFK